MYFCNHLLYFIGSRGYISVIVLILIKHIYKKVQASYVTTKLNQFIHKHIPVKKQ